MCEKCTICLKFQCIACEIMLFTSMGNFSGILYLLSGQIETNIMPVA